MLSVSTPIPKGKRAPMRGVQLEREGLEVDVGNGPDVNSDVLQPELFSRGVPVEPGDEDRPRGRLGRDECWPRLRDFGEGADMVSVQASNTRLDPWVDDDDVDRQVDRHDSKP